MGRKSSTKKSVHTDVPGCFNGIWNAPELEETPVARKSLSERKFSEGFEAPRNSLDIGSALFDRQQNHSNSNSVSAQQSSDEVPFGFEFALRTPDKPGPPRLTMPSPGAAAAAEPKCRSPSVIARLMGLDTLPSAQQSLNSDRKSPLQAQAWNLMADRCDFSSRHEHFSRQLSSNGTVVPPSAPLIPFSAPAAAPAASAHHKPSMSASNYEDELLLFDVLPYREQHPQEKQLQKLKDEFQSRRAKLEQLKEELTFKQLQVQRQLDRSNSLPSMPRSSVQSAVKSKDPKEMLEAIKFLQSNKDFLVRFLQEPNSVFSKHVYDLQSKEVVDKRSKVGSNTCISREQKSPKAAGFSRRLSEPAAAAVDDESLRKNQSSSSDHGSRIILLKPNMRKQSTCTASSAGPRTRPGDSSSVALARNQLKDIDSSMDPRELAKEIARHARERVNKEVELENARRVDQELSSNGWLSADGEGSEPSSRRYTTKEYQSPQQTAASLPTSPRLNKTKSNVSSSEGRKQLLEKLTTHSDQKSNVVIQIEVPSTGRKKQSKAAPLEAEAASRKHHKGKLLKLFSKDPSGSKGSPDDSPRHLVRSKSVSSLTDERSHGAQVLDRTHSCRQTSNKSSASEGGSKGKFSSLKSSLLGKKRSSSARSSDNATVSSPEISNHQRGSTRKEPEADQQDRLARACKKTVPEKVEFTQAFSKLAEDVESPRFLSLEISDAASDIHVEKSEQPSPVSVLERVFLEGSPSPVSFEDATSDLQELQSRLERLKLEESERTCTEEKTKDSTQQETSQSSSYDSESSPSSRSPSCQKEEDEDQQYIRKLLEVSGFTQSVQSLEIWHSPSCPLDPCLFGKLEEQYSDPQLPCHWQTNINKHGSRPQRKLKIGRSINQVQRRPETLHRQMLFDVVNEVLSSKFQHLWNDQPWISSTKHGIRPVPSGKYLLQDVYRGISSYKHRYDNQEYPLESLVERDLQKGDQWMDHQSHVLRITARLEREIFNNLLEEVAFSLI